MVLAKKGIPVNCKGMQFTNTNINTLLNRRFMRKDAACKSKRKQVKGMNNFSNIDKTTSLNDTLIKLLRG